MKNKKIYPMLILLVSFCSLVPSIVFIITDYDTYYFIAIGVSIIFLGIYIAHQFLASLLTLSKVVKNVLDLVILLPGFIIALSFIVTDVYDFLYSILFYFGSVTFGLMIVVSILDIFNLNKVNYYILGIAPLVMAIVYTVLYLVKYKISYLYYSLYLLVPLIFWISVSVYTLLFFKDKTNKGIKFLGLSTASTFFSFTLEMIMGLFLFGAV